MPYLLCKNCGGYYKMQEGESADGFDVCQCGGSLKYVESVHEIFNKSKSVVICHKCGRESIGCVFCPHCGTILDAKESSRTNEYFSFHKIEVKSPKTLFGGRKATSTNPKDWFIRDRLRVNADGNYFREEVSSMFDRHENGGPGLNHSWSPEILIQDVIIGHDNHFIRLLKTKKHIVAGYLFYFFSMVILYFFWGDPGFQLSTVAVLFAGIITSITANVKEYSNIFLDINILGGLCIFTPVIITFMALRYFFFIVPGNDLSTIRLLLILLSYGVMANIGGFTGAFIRMR